MKLDLIFAQFTEMETKESFESITTFINGRFKKLEKYPEFTDVKDLHFLATISPILMEYQYHQELN